MDTAVIAFTGPFGSGCTTAAKHIRDERHFKFVRLSEVIRSEWSKTRGATIEPSRSDLQLLGDQLRKDHNPGYLAKVAIENQGSDFPGWLAVDAIRNVGEVRYLQDTFGNKLTLIAVLASPDARWERIKSSAYADKGLGKKDFVQEDTRDRNEETPWGQQVELCIDQADVMIDNSEEVTLGKFKEKVLNFADLVTGRSPRHAQPREIMMNLAYGASHSSKCLKRHVGAVLVDEHKQIVAVGYNENPATTHPCVEEPSYDYRCYRDIVRNEHFANLSMQSFRCPRCGEPLPPITGPPWDCPTCKGNAQKTNLEAFFFPDRAMNWCTAVHAEVMALLAAGERARNTALYVTTFPCMQCAEKLAQAGVREVWFTEAYPDSYSFHRLRLAGINVKQFEGVRSSSFERIFSQVKPMKLPGGGQPITTH
jgi:deoxycytidylate deaminase/dephospho-CoA kinase